MSVFFSHSVSVCLYENTRKILYNGNGLPLYSLIENVVSVRQPVFQHYKAIKTKEKGSVDARMHSLCAGMVNVRRVTSEMYCICIRCA